MVEKGGNSHIEGKPTSHLKRLRGPMASTIASIFMATLAMKAAEVVQASLGSANSYKYESFGEPTMKIIVTTEAEQERAQETIGSLISPNKTK
jgi:hypothetical protein